MCQQLDLFSWNPPEFTAAAVTMVGAPPRGAAIVPFPLNRNGRKIRHVAQILAKREGRAAESYWHRIIGDLAAMLVRAGIDDGEIHSQLMAFRAAVELEMRRRNACAGATQYPGGAA